MRRERDQADESRERTDANPQPALKKNRWAIDNTRILACRADAHQPFGNAAPADAIAAT